MKNKLVSIIIAGIIFLGVGIFTLISFRNTLKENLIIMSSDSFEIIGQYGEEYNYSDIQSLELKDTIPDITRKTNGASLGDIKKGYFDVEGLGNCKLYIYSNEGPYVYIKVDGKYVILNSKDEYTIQKFYEDLSSKLNN